MANYETECLNLIVIVLNSNSDSNRWDDISKLKEWAIDRLNSVEEYLESLNKPMAVEEREDDKKTNDSTNA